MVFFERTTRWLEAHWVNPAYGGWLMGGLAIFFFGAATNTMAGWLYAISGLMAAILVLAAALPIRTLRGLRLHREPIAPVSAGETLTLAVQVENPTPQSKTLIQLQDDLPAPLPAIRTAIEQIPPQGSYRWVAELPVERRGVYRWQTLHCRTAAPLGLFWRRWSQSLPAKAIVYPTVLQLSHCPLVDELGQETRSAIASPYQARLANEGMTRTLRPYRWGDSTRLIHWRSSARYGDLRVRELETHIGEQELVIGLASGQAWEQDGFEQAVIAAASLYFHALHRRIQVSLWTAGTGLIRGDQVILEVLAGIQPQELALEQRPDRPLLWLTSDPEELPALPAGSRWLLWNSSAQTPTLSPGNPSTGRIIQGDQPLQPQLQR